MININNNLDIIEKSKKTNLPISYVPLILFYVNGIPYVQYTGEYNLEHIQIFINRVISNLQKSKKENLQFNNTNQEKFIEKKKIICVH